MLPCFLIEINAASTALEYIRKIGVKWDVYSILFTSWRYAESIVRE